MTARLLIYGEQAHGQSWAEALEGVRATGRELATLAMEDLVR